jgi:hypothetical protein
MEFRAYADSRGFSKRIAGDSFNLRYRHAVVGSTFAAAQTELESAQMLVGDWGLAKDHLGGHGWHMCYCGAQFRNFCTSHARIALDLWMKWRHR